MSFLAGIYNSFYLHPWKSYLPFSLVLIIRLAISFVDMSALTGNQASFTDKILDGGVLMESFLDLLVNILLISLFVINVLSLLSRIKWKASWWVILLSLIFYWFLILEILQITVKNTSIPLDLHNIFALNENTLLLFIVLGLLFYSVQYAFEWYTSRILSKPETARNSVIVTIFLFLIFGLFRVLI